MSPTRTASPAPSVSPSDSAARSARPSSSATAVAAPADRSEQASSAQSVSTHPVTRSVVILLLIGLGTLYYARLRSGGTPSGGRNE
jgi:hypothetical protein